MDKTHVEAEVVAHSQNKSRNLTMSDSSGGAGTRGKVGSVLTYFAL